MDLGLPVVPGLTDTAQAATPLHERLIDFLAQRPGGASEDIVEGLSSLERAYSREADPVLRRRIAAARAILRGTDEDEAAA